MSSRIVPSALATLVDLADRLQKGDRAGAASLATDPALVEAALKLGLDRPAGSDGWRATRQRKGADGADLIEFSDGSSGERSFSAALVEQGGAWQVRAVEKAAPAGSMGAVATTAPGAALPALEAFHMIDEKTGWALTAHAALRTVDGASTWADVTPRGLTITGTDGGATWAGQRFLDADHAWLAVAGGSDAAGNGRSLAIWHTPDGGRTWLASVPAVEGMSAQFSFIDPQYGWALTAPGQGTVGDVQLYRTRDGARSWTQVAGNVPLAQPAGLAFVGEQLGWAWGFARPEPLLLRTSDGGRTWARVSTGAQR